MAIERSWKFATVIRILTLAALGLTLATGCNDERDDAATDTGSADIGAGDTGGTDTGGTDTGGTDTGGTDTGGTDTGGTDTGGTDTGGTDTGGTDTGGTDTGGTDTGGTDAGSVCEGDGDCIFGVEWCEDGACTHCPDFDCAECPGGFNNVYRNGCFTCACEPVPECDADRPCPPNAVCVGVGTCTDDCMDGDPSCCESAICEPVTTDPCGPSPAGCVETGCEDGFVCDTGVGCTPSSCFCDPDSGGWACTDDCGGGTCVPRSGPCTRDDDCPLFEVCEDGTCAGLACPEIYAPVCGVDGVTYPNACEARRAHAPIAYEGDCRDEVCNSNEDCDGDRICHRRTRVCEPACDTFTCFVPDPVCGEDGRTYICGEVHAWCHGVEMAFDGPCEDAP